MGCNLSVGDFIPLSYKAADYSDDQFVRAFVTDEDGDPITGSPFDLTPNATGQYVNTEGVMPNKSSIFVEYNAYSDSGYTTLSERLGGSDDTFSLLPSVSSSGLPPATDIVAYVQADECSQSPIQTTIVQGSDRALFVRLVEEAGGNPFSLGDATLVEFRFRNADGTILSLKTTDSGAPVAIVSPATAGRVRCTLTAAQTLLLAPRTPAPFTIVVTLSSGKTIINVPTQLAIVEQDV